MTDDLSQALVSCREKVEGLYKDIERLNADNARLSADYLSRIPREHYEQMQAQIDELSRKCVRLSEERDRLRVTPPDTIPAEKVRGLVERWKSEKHLVPDDALRTHFDYIDDLTGLLELDDDE